MRFVRIFVPLLGVTSMALAQLTPAQKQADFLQLAGLYAKNYGPYELRRDVFNYDLFNVKPWLDQIAASKDDIDFYDILTKYVASLQDSHDEFLIPSDFEAWLHMDADYYDGKVLIGDLDRDYLPRTKYPFDVGDEIVSVDGIAIADLVQSLIPYAANGSGNKFSQKRLAAGSVFDRVQFFNPRAAQIGDSATVVIKRQNGNVETYTIPWDKTGTAMVKVGPVPSPHTSAVERFGPKTVDPRVSARRPGRGPAWDNPWGVWQGPRPAIAPDPVPDYLQVLRKLEFGGATLAPLSERKKTTAGLDPFDFLTPVFDPPPGFKLRLGAKSTDQFISGTFPVGKAVIGFIRIPTMSPPSQNQAFNQFVNEILFFQQNTDGLVVDVMANGGGSGCYAQALASALIPQTFHGLTFEIRATQNWVASFSSSVSAAQRAKAEEWVINLYKAYLAEVQTAFSENRGMTGPLPVCGPSIDASTLIDVRGNKLAYTKPILLLTDNFTLSAAEIFTMMLQDSKRATIFGDRTDGGGGSVVEFDATDYSEGAARVTLDLIVREHPVATPGFAPGPYNAYYDGQGIYPDILESYQTLDNLLNGGQTFVSDFSAAIANLVKK